MEPTTIKFEELIELFRKSYAVDFDGQLRFVKLQEHDDGETYGISRYHSYGIALEDGFYTISKKDNEEVEVQNGDTYVVYTRFDEEEDDEEEDVDVFEVTFLTSMKR